LAIVGILRDGGEEAVAFGEIGEILGCVFHG
jgi:hypothetical protein